MEKGHYFGEVSMVFGCNRTCNIESMSYCTMALLHEQHFKKLIQKAPEIYHSLRDAALSYNDEWTKFKVKFISEVQYFKNALIEKDKRE